MPQVREQQAISSPTLLTTVKQLASLVVFKAGFRAPEGSLAKGSRGFQNRRSIIFTLITSRSHRIRKCVNVF